MILENGVIRQDGEGSLHIRFNNGQYVKVMFKPTLGRSHRAVTMRENGDLNESTDADSFIQELQDIANLK